jgi:hypothetical protein
MRSERVKKKRVRGDTYAYKRNEKEGANLLVLLGGVVVAEVAIFVAPHVVTALVLVERGRARGLARLGNAAGRAAAARPGLDVWDAAARGDGADGGSRRGARRRRLRVDAALARTRVRRRASAWARGRVGAARGLAAARLRAGARAAVGDGAARRAAVGHRGAAAPRRADAAAVVVVQSALVGLLLVLLVVVEIRVQLPFVGHGSTSKF